MANAFRILAFLKYPITKLEVPLSTQVRQGTAPSEAEISLYVAHIYGLSLIT